MYGRVGTELDPRLRKKLDWLRTTHFVAFALHAINAAALGWLAPHFAVFNSSVFITSATFPATTITSEIRTGVVPVHWFPLIIFVVAALHHLATLVMWTDNYDRDVATGRDWMSWIEQCLTMPLINVIVAIICGVTQVGELVCISVLSLSTMAFCSASEASVVTNNNNTNSSDDAWRLLAVSLLPFAALWTDIGLVFNYTLSDAPGFVTAMFVVMFLIELAFVCNTARELASRGRRPTAKDSMAPTVASVADVAVYGAFYKIILSVVAKLTVTWLAYGGIVMRAPQPK